MINLLRPLLSGAAAPIFGLILIAITIFWFGPYIGFGQFRPLAGVVVRIVLIAIIFLVWGVLKFLKRRAAAKADEQLADDLVDSAEQEGGLAPDQSAEEVALLKQRFEEAIATLRASSKHKSNVSLYELPWFVIIGPPGSGKTTALVNSGLEFPLEQRFGKEALRGVGGTRNCDWWFTNDAVLLDTAGRYVTQDSHETVDRAAWEGFLDLLKKYRKRRPINGVLVAISLSDLLLQSDAERNAQVLAIRHRIQDLYQHFGIRFPVYMLFTKCDLVAGFIEFFDDLDQEGRQQVWGTTFPLAMGKKAAEDDITKFQEELNLLLEQLTDRMTWRLSQERDLHRRSKIYNFPQQVIALAGTLDNFLRDVFSSNRYEDQILIRGVYFTSGTQEGTPIDRMMSVMAKTFGMQEQALPSFGGKGRSYFITQLFRKIIFQESGLAGVNPRVEKQRRWLQAAAYVGSISLAVLATFAWIMSFSANRSYLAEVTDSLSDYQQSASIATGPRASIEQVLPRLDSLRRVLDVASQHDESVPMHMRMWLYQGRAMQGRVGDAYLRELNATLGPTVITILETRIRENAGNPQLLYEYLKAYMMLGDPERLQSQQLAFLIGEEWRRSYSASPELYSRLRSHTDYLFENGVLPYAVNQRLIAGAQATLAQAPLSDFLYSRLKLDALAYDDRDLVLTNELGIALEKVFRRKSGTPLSEPISVLFTNTGFTELYPVLSSQLIAEAGKENWVLGRDDAGLSVREVATIETALREQYTSDYIATWRRLLLDLEIVPFSSEAQAMETLSLITARPSVMRELLGVVAEHTALSEATADDGAEGGTAESESRLSRIFGTDTGAATGALTVTNPGDPIAREFASVNRLVAGQAGQPTAMDPLLLLVADMQQELDASGGDALRVISSGGGPAARRVRTEAGRQPEPVKSWLTQLGGGSQALAASSARSELSTRYRDTVLAECRRLVDGRYPFERNSNRDVAIDDFGRMFGYGGVLDNFFNENLAAFVDRSGGRWRLRSGSGLSISAAALQRFRHAEQIREAYFRPGSQQAEMRLTMIPNRLDADVSRFVLEVDGQSFDYRHGPQREWSVAWPGQGLGMARIMFEEASGGRPTVVEEGPWAFFRLLDDSRVTANSEINYTAELSAGGRVVEVLIQANSVRNPLSRRDLHSFDCSAGL
jgi:type VI secretion system protein ImpL